MNQICHNPLENSQYIEVIDLLSYPIAIIDSAGVIRLVNSSWKEFACFKHFNISNWIGIDYLQLCSQGSQTCIPQSLKKILNQDIDYIKIEYHCEDKDCNHFFQLSANKIRINDTDYLMVSHEEVLAKEELIKSQQRLSIAVNAAQIGIWDYDLKTQSLHWDSWMYKIYGICPNQTQAAYNVWENSVHPEDLAQAVDDFNKAVRTGENFESEFRIIRGDGEIRHIQASAKVITDSQRIAIRLVGTNIDITQTKKSETKIYELAYFDQLTKLPNRRLLEDRVCQSLVLNRKLKSYASLLFVDIDNFKSVNALNNHNVGDQVLRALADRISSNIELEATACRLSGDKFMVFLPHISNDKLEAMKHVKSIARKLIQKIQMPLTLNSTAFKLTASIGMTLFNGEAVYIEDLIKQAELAMYKVKESGRNNISFYDPQMQIEILQRKQMENDLERAVLNDEFNLFYQAQVSNHSGVVGAEALLRWFHPEQGIISPDKFIPQLEETGLIVLVGEKVLHDGCKKLQQWASIPEFSQLTLSVNVSSAQLLHEGFSSYVIQLVSQFKIKSGKLKLEITESTFIENIDATIAVMNELASVGVQFSLDDFGTGFSSLSYLKSLPLTELKIDKSFIKDIIKDGSDMAISQTIVNLANSLKFDVIAEGVECAEQQYLLHQIGCNNYQGYHFNRPAEADEFEAFAKNYNKQLRPKPAGAHEQCLTHQSQLRA
ncbi:putative bifunctional diguanylate cyclase/phosphodiesterase [Shewanella fidelis]|uniref:putative bifunctional diguanylate cyclase/phosphodiesterase n=1 Tax=Shewanella fidelis TaxID=173509 RepID=UPI0004B5A409|nr:bifunctional diguanylate cyclase/phosphodiesterase [Shewanella fidelis]